MSTSIGSKKAVIWQARLDGFKPSGMTVEKYCQSLGCTPATFYYWRRKLATPSFRQVKVAPMPATASVSIELPNGTQLSVSTQDLAAVRSIVQELLRFDHNGGQPC